MKFSIEISPKEAKSIIAQVIEMYSASVVDKLEQAANNPEATELIQSILEACKNEEPRKECDKELESRYLATAGDFALYGLLSKTATNKQRALHNKHPKTND